MTLLCRVKGSVASSHPAFSSPQIFHRQIEGWQQGSVSRGIVRPDKLALVEICSVRLWRAISILQEGLRPGILTIA